MSDTVRQLIVDGVTVPVWAMISISQRYEPVQGSYRSRMRSGTLKQRTIWNGKMRTVVTGSGVIPAALTGIDYTGSFTLSCIAHRGVLTASTSVALPSARRSDAGSEPYGRALVGDQWVATPVSMGGDTATITAVTGATQYQVVYFPEITVFADPPTEDKPEHGPNFGWSLVAEEI